MGRFFLSFVSGRWFLYYGFALGFFLAFCLAQMFFEKSCAIRHTLRWLMPSAAIATVLYALMLLATLFGARFYTQYVPEPARVSGVYLSHEARGTQEGAFLTDTAAIEAAITLHRLILDIRSDLTQEEIQAMDRAQRRDVRDEQSAHRGDMRDAFWQSISGGGRRFAEGGGAYLYITYALYDGELLYRRYALPGAFLARPEVGPLLPGGAPAPGGMPLPGGAAADPPIDPIFGSPAAVEFILMRFHFPGGEPFEFFTNEEAEIVLFLDALHRDILVDRAQAAGERVPLLTAHIGVWDAYWDLYNPPIFELAYIAHTESLLLDTW
jgi:hypothetical protein